MASHSDWKPTQIYSVPQWLDSWRKPTLHSATIYGVPLKSIWNLWRTTGFLKKTYTPERDNLWRTIEIPMKFMAYHSDWIPEENIHSRARLFMAYHDWNPYEIYGVPDWIPEENLHSRAPTIYGVPLKSLWNLWRTTGFQKKPTLQSATIYGVP